jgi:hypothetical protein
MGSFRSGGFDDNSDSNELTCKTTCRRSLNMYCLVCRFAIFILRKALGCDSNDFDCRHNGTGDHGWPFGKCLSSELFCCNVQVALGVLIGLRVKFDAPTCARYSCLRKFLWQIVQFAKPKPNCTIAAFRFAQAAIISGQKTIFLPRSQNWNQKRYPRQHRQAKEIDECCPRDLTLSKGFGHIRLPVIHFETFPSLLLKSCAKT